MGLLREDKRSCYSGRTLFFVWKSLCSCSKWLGYLLGESFGWGDWVANLVYGKVSKVAHIWDEGAKNGIQYISKNLFLTILMSM